LRSFSPAVNARDPEILGQDVQRDSCRRGCEGNVAVSCGTNPLLIKSGGKSHSACESDGGILEAPSALALGTACIPSTNDGNDAM